MTYSTPPSGAPLDQPLYGATISQAVQRFFKKYATFSGRASRSEYWWVALVLGLAYLVLAILAGVLGAATRSAGSSDPGPGLIPIAIILVLGGLAIIVPSIALGVRRLHDANFSGWLYLIHLVPYVGSLVVLVLTIMPSNPLGARFDLGAQPQYIPPASPYAAAPPAPPAAGSVAPPPAPPAGPTAPPAPPAPPSA